MRIASMQPDRDSLIKVFSYYRDAELRGAHLLMKMMQRCPDAHSQVLFSRHIADEMRHQRLWTDRIQQEGALPVPVPDGYQRRLGKAIGIPSNMLELFALSVVVEERAAKRYRAHEANPACDEITRELLITLMQDEKWHISWMEDRMLEMANGKREELDAILARYRRIEREVYEEMKDIERGWLGFSFSDAEDEETPVERSSY